MAVKMTSRKRFREAMAQGVSDRVPYFEEGLREAVLAAWKRQGMPPEALGGTPFPADRRVGLQPELDPRPRLRHYPSRPGDLAEFVRCFAPDDPDRLAVDGCDLAAAGTSDGPVTMLRVHRGFFLSMGVEAWPRFRELMEMLTAAPRG